MKIEIPIVGIRHGKAVVDILFENICAVANIDTMTIIGRPSRNREDNAKQFILIRDNVVIRKKYEDIPQSILNIYPNRPRKTLVYFFEVNMDNDKLDTLSEEEFGLVQTIQSSEYEK
jgi:hypothetical protein